MCTPGRCFHVFKSHCLRFSTTDTGPLGHFGGWGRVWVFSHQMPETPCSQHNLKCPQTLLHASPGTKPPWAGATVLNAFLSCWRWLNNKHAISTTIRKTNTLKGQLAKSPLAGQLCPSGDPHCPAFNSRFWGKTRGFGPHPPGLLFAQRILPLDSDANQEVAVLTLSLPSPGGCFRLGASHTAPTQLSFGGGTAVLLQG